MSATRNIAATKSPYKQKYSIIIPAAGQGTRMKSYGPKALLNIGSKSLLEHQIEKINNTFIRSEIILVTGFEAEKIKRRAPDNIRVIENKDYQSTNVAYSIQLGLSKVKTDKVLIIYGDLAFNNKALQLPLFKESLIVLDGEDTMKKDEVGCIHQNQLLLNMMYGLPVKWAQILFITGKELQLCKEILSEEDSYHLFGFEIINKILNKGGKFTTYIPIGGRCIDIDTSKDICKATKICEE